ncbi:hypothetical protein O7627_24035 [Solwaraspora sp. WMMD1047]|uniref:hypothetical protein n=1 Tax=Solwaraspora sp. WMMD1047 TaxID=3016102 RepID=UPI0024179FE3|nr:hypothetical protein [Solwaraspora sp. WMMD1047]MDG4832354.1 hypothetical protein [Solwaraspora sp. WMMD1047]
MTGVVGFLVVAAGVAGIAGGLVWLGARIRRRGGGVDVLGPFEEIWHPAAHRSRLEIQAQEEWVAPMPTPDRERPQRPSP